MAITIDWAARIINVPRADLLLVQTLPIEIRELDLSAFRLDLKDLEDSVDGMSFPDTHRHNTIVSIGGITLARVIEIINGYTVTFEDGSYAVNLVGANSNVGDVVNLNTVSVRSANSAGLTYSKQIEDQSFNEGRVWISAVVPGHGASPVGTTQTQFPAGTAAQPVADYVTAKKIIDLRKLPNWLGLRGTLTVNALADLSHSNWLGDSPVVSTLVFAGQDMHYMTLKRITITGITNGDFTCEDGVLQDVSDFKGDASNSAIAGNIILWPGVHDSIITFHNCFSNTPGTSTPVLDCNNATNLAIQFRAYTGGIEIKNCSDAGNVFSIDLLSGRIVLDSSVTEGTFVIRGVGTLTNNAGPNVSIVQTGLANTNNLLTEKRWIALK